MSSERRVVVLSGNPRPQSRTAAVAGRLAQELASAGVSPTVIELGELGPLLFDSDAAEAVAAKEAVKTATIVVVATPSYKGSLTGLLKVFLDSFAGGELAGIDAFPVVLAASVDHVDSTTDHLRLVLSELGLAVRPGLALTEQDLVAVDSLIEQVVADER